MGEAARKKLMNGSAVQPPTDKPQITQRVPRIAIVCPSSSSVSNHFAVSLAAVLSHSVANGLAMGVINEAGSMVSKARNNLVDKAINVGEGGADYLFWTDSDMIYPADAILRLLKHGKDIVGATYNMRLPPHKTLGHFLGEKRDLSGGGLIEADYMPGGLMLIKADVYRKLAWPWYFECYRRGGPAVDNLIGVLRDSFALPLPAEIEEDIRKNESIRAWLEAAAKQEFDGGAKGYLSEDYAFSRKARRGGFQIWCDLDLSFQCAHVGEQKVTLERPMPKTATPVMPIIGSPMAAMIDLRKAPAPA